MDFPARPGLRIPTSKVRSLVAIPATLAGLGADPDEVLRAAGLDPAVFADLDAVIPFTAVGRIVAESVKATGCECFGLMVGMKTGPSAMGLAGLVSIHSATVRQGLETITATLRTFDTGGATFLDVKRNVARFGYAVTAPGIEGADHIVDGSIAIAFNLLAHLCGPAWRPQAVCLARDPPRDRTPYLKFFQAPVEFKAQTSCIVFDGAVLDEAARGRDPLTAGVLEPLLREAAENVREDFVSLVRATIRARLAAGGLSRESVARALGIGERTLANRLEDLGLTYSALAEEAKFEVAKSLLNARKPIAEIADRLGFAEASAFTRAFKVWSGTTPARWRMERR